MTSLTDAQLQQIMPALPAAKRALYLGPLNAAMQRCGVDTALRCAAFVAQLAHESGEFRWMEELWGPTAAQLRYEPPADLARRLGNTAVGDGKRFKGRGPIQITGRFNYRRFGELLGVDLVAEPARAAAPELAFATAGLFWQTNGLNELADARQFVAITKRINGGTNGLAERQKYYERAQAVLGIGAAARGAARSAPLTRGFEAIAADLAPAKKKAPSAGRAVAAAAAQRAPAQRAPTAAARPTVAKAAPVKAAKKSTTRSASKGMPKIAPTARPAARPTMPTKKAAAAVGKRLPKAAARVERRPA